MTSLLLGEHEVVGQWICQRAGGTWWKGQGYAIGVLRSRKLVAGVSFTEWNGVSLQIHVASTPGQWVSRKLLHTVFDYAFNFVKARKLIGIVGAKNLAAIQFDEHVGFVREATLRDAHPDGDLLIYSMTPDQCRWLDRRGNGKELRTASRLRSAGTSASAGEQGFGSVQQQREQGRPDHPARELDLELEAGR